MKTKSNNNLSKLQSEAVKEIGKMFTFQEGKLKGSSKPIFDWQKPILEKLVSDQIQKAYSKGREEAVEVIKKHRPVFFKGDLKSLLSQDEVMTVREVLRIEILEELGIDCSKMRLSIQSKEK